MLCVCAAVCLMKTRVLSLISDAAHQLPCKTWSSSCYLLLAKGSWSCLSSPSPGRHFPTDSQDCRYIYTHALNLATEYNHIAAKPECSARCSCSHLLTLMHAKTADEPHHTPPRQAQALNPSKVVHRHQHAEAFVCRDTCFELPS